MDRYNLALEAIEEKIGEPLDTAALARLAHTSKHHFRRVFTTLTGMGLSEYVRRRRMTLAAAEVVAGEQTILDIALRFGYESADSFARAFHSVHGIAPSDARHAGVSLTTQPRIVLHLTAQGRNPMTYRIEQTPALRVIGRSIRVPLVHLGPNPAIAAFVASIPVEETIALKTRNDVAPRGVLAVSIDLDDDREEGSMLTYLHGVATTGDTPDGADVIDVPVTTWAVFIPDEPSDEALQLLWRRVIVEWLPANNWRLAPGPEVVAMNVDEDGALARELWIPVAADR